MYNYELFKKIFGLYATELWAKPEKEFLEWLNAKAEKEVKPIVYGKWIVEKDKDGNSIGRCSNCSYTQPIGAFKYCPNCGAKMKGAEEL